MRQPDLHQVLDDAGMQAMDAACALRELIGRPMPMRYRRNIDAALRDFERAQVNLFKARRGDECPPPPKDRQLALL